MSSLHGLKKFVNERLTAAAEEIFGVFEKTLSEYEKEIVRQRRLLDIVLKPQIKLQRTELPQQYIYKEEQVLNDQQLCNLEKNSSLDPEPPQIKEEQEEICTSQEVEQFVQEQETEAFKLSRTYDKRDYGEDQTLLFDRVQAQSVSVREPHLRLESGSDRDPSSVIEPTSDNSQQVRTGQKQHMCTICGKSFKMRTDLKMHMKIHTGKKPYSCKYCKKEFATSSSVSRHLRVHTGEKPYECRLCGKRFNVSTTLKVHYRIHTGERPYKCKTCGRAFTTSSNLKKHMSLYNKV